MEPAPPQYTTCSNCGCARVEEFCPRCGQEQGPPVPTVSQVVAEIGDSLFGYDSRIVRTLRGLRTPGFLTCEYLQGRRAGYLTPFRLYLLVSAVYLFLSLAISTLKDANQPAPPPTQKTAAKKAQPTPSPELKADAFAEAEKGSADAEKTQKEADKPDAKASKETAEGQKNAPDNKPADDASDDKTAKPSPPDATKSPDKDAAPEPPDEPEKEKTSDGFQRWASSHETLATLLVLPLFALLLYKVYGNQRPLFLAHLVFALHLQVVSYVLAIALFMLPTLLTAVITALHVPILGWLTGLVANVGWLTRFIVLYFYLARAIPAVYGEGHGKARRTTILLFCALLFLTVIRSNLFGWADSIVPSASLARFLPN